MYVSFYKLQYTLHTLSRELVVYCLFQVQHSIDISLDWLERGGKKKIYSCSTSAYPTVFIIRVYVKDIPDDSIITAWWWLTWWSTLSQFQIALIILPSINNIDSHSPSHSIKKRIQFQSQFDSAHHFLFTFFFFFIFESFFFFSLQFHWQFCGFESEQCNTRTNLF